MKADKAAFDAMRRAVKAVPDSPNGTAWRDTSPLEALAKRK